LAVGAGAPLTEAVTLANYASGLVVQKFGNYAPTVREIAHALGVNE
jgi:bifunctional ADP-heptose synthase (sugar kinase/adenylyltransferase)